MTFQKADPCAGFVRPKLVDALVAYIRTQIVIGNFDDTLPGERKLAERLGVSRPSLRSALAKLEKEGLILRRHGRETRLTQLSSEPR